MNTHGDQLFIGVSTLKERLNALAYTVQLGLMDPWSTEWVSRVVRDLPHGNMAGSDVAEVAAVFEALKRGVRYTFHPNMDRMQTLRRSLELGMADCDNASVALATALTILNFKVAWAIMGTQVDLADHIWARVWLPRMVPVGSPGGRWFDMDLTTGPDGTPNSAVVGYAVPYESRAFWRQYVLRFA